ncbi:MAG: oligoendopeptidase F, partial [Ardenticatenaceae bacterium]
DLFRRQEHVRSAEVEEVLGMVQDPLVTASNTAEVLVNADLKFEPAVSSEGEEIPVAQGNIDTLLMSTDRELRRSAWQSYADAHLAFKNTLANNLTVAVNGDVFFARARRYASALEASLDANHIPTELFHNLIATYRRNLPTWHRYWAIRRRALGYDTLHPYDIKAPLTSRKPVLSYAQAVDWVSAGLQPLGEEYVRVLRRGSLEERWIDIYPNQGKRQGAFSSGWPGTHPFILMSFTDDLESLSTLAHELGHSMHSYFTWQSQPVVYSQYSMFVAEVASNFNQALVRAHLLENNDDPTFQIAVIEEAMSNFHRYFFIMPALARFELEMHERVERGEGITADSLTALMADLFQEGFGEEVVMDRARVGITWAEFQHLYSNFYVFQYATGISAAHALAERVRSDGPDAAEDYLAFLSAGGSLYPLDALQRAGVDMRSPEPVETTFQVLTRFVDRLEELVMRDA